MEWRSIPGYSRYSASSNGLVRGDVVGRGRKLGVLATHTSASGYVRVGIARDDGARSSVGVHRLVALAFVPASAKRPHVNHIDFDRSNNAASNLEWVTAAENNAHSKGAGRVVCPRGEAVRRAKLTWSEVNEIRDRWAKGETFASLASTFGVAPSLVHGIVHNKRWVRR